MLITQQATIQEWSCLLVTIRVNREQKHIYAYDITPA